MSSSNHVLLYGIQRMVRVKTYTFKVVVGNQSKDVKVELKSYTGHQEEYSNNPVSQHSGGTTQAVKDNFSPPQSETNKTIHL